MPDKAVEGGRTVKINPEGKEDELISQPGTFRMPDQWILVGRAIEDIGRGGYAEVDFTKAQVRKARKRKGGKDGGNKGNGQGPGHH